MENRPARDERQSGNYNVERAKLLRARGNDRVRRAPERRVHTSEVAAYTSEYIRFARKKSGKETKWSHRYSLGQPGEPYQTSSIIGDSQSSRYLSSRIGPCAVLRKEKTQVVGGGGGFFCKAGTRARTTRGRASQGALPPAPPSSHIRAAHN